MGRILVLLMSSLLAIAFLGARTSFLTSSARDAPSPDTSSPDGSSPVVNFTSIGMLYSNCQEINVEFTANVTASNGVATVMLYYKLVGVSMWQSQEMDNIHGKFVATIGVFLDGDNLCYYANATDAQGNFTCAPVGAPMNYYTTRVFCQSGPPPWNLWQEIITFAVILGAGGVGVGAYRSYHKSKWREDSITKEF